jgi:DNA processing protein
MLAATDWTMITPEDAAWPADVNDLGAEAPAALWVRGDVEALSLPNVAVTGMRASTAYGEHVAEEIATGLVAHDRGVINGGAYGIDGAALCACLESNGRPVVVLAGGVDVPYPSGHAELIGLVARAGAVVSEFAPGTPPTRAGFERRNALLVALATKVVVVESGMRGGAMNVAMLALKHRDLWAVPGPITSPASAGTNHLLAEVAHPYPDASLLD